MRIVHLIPSYFPYQSGGSAYSLFRLNSGLSGYKKIIISHKSKKNSDTRNHIIFDKNHEVFFCSKFSFRMYSKLFSELRKADLIQMSSFFFPPNLFAFFLAKVFDLKLIISPRGEFFERALNRKKKQKIFFTYLFKILSPKVTFHATSKEEVEIIKKFITNGKEKNIAKIYNSFHSKYSFSEKRRNQFLFLGRINPIKNIHSVFEAIKNIENFTFLIAGEANLSYEKEYFYFLQTKIKQLGIQNKVKFLGKIHNEDKYRLIASCRCLVLPSHSENFGNVVLESLSQGTPVIASLGTPWNLLEVYKCGYHIDFNLEENLRKKLINFLSLDEAGFLTLETNSKKLMKKFETSIINDSWVKLYNTCNCSTKNYL